MQRLRSARWSKRDDRNEESERDGRMDVFLSRAREIYSFWFCSLLLPIVERAYVMMEDMYYSSYLVYEGVVV